MIETYRVPEDADHRQIHTLDQQPSPRHESAASARRVGVSQSCLIRITDLEGRSGDDATGSIPGDRRSPESPNDQAGICSPRTADRDRGGTLEGAPSISR